MDNIVLTEKGLALRDKLNAGQTTATFTRFCTSSAEYDQSELGALTELKDSKLESAVTNLEIREDHTMVISGAVDNKSLQEGYYITLIGLYAKETDGEEILFAVSKVSSPMYMPEKSGALSGMSIRFSVKIENSDSINVTVDPTTAATLGDLNALRSEVTTPTFEDYESEESPALPALEDAMKQIKSGNTMRVILQNTKAAFKGLLNLVNAKVNQKDYDAAVSKLNGDIASFTENLKWKLFGTKAGSNNIDIKELITAGREIRVIVEAQYSSSSSKTTRFIYDLPSEDIVDIYSAGYCYSNSNYASVSISVYQSGILHIIPSWWKIVEKLWQYNSSQ